MNKGRIIVGAVIVGILIIGVWWFISLNKTGTSSQSSNNADLGTSSQDGSQLVTTFSSTVRNDIIQKLANVLINSGDVTTKEGRNLFMQPKTVTNELGRTYRVNNSYEEILGELDSWNQDETADTWKLKITTYKDAIAKIKKGIETKDDSLIIGGVSTLEELKQFAVDSLR